MYLENSGGLKNGDNSIDFTSIQNLARLRRELLRGMWTSEQRELELSGSHFYQWSMRMMREMKVITFISRSLLVNFKVAYKLSVFWSSYLGQIIS